MALNFNPYQVLDPEQYREKQPSFQGSVFDPINQGFNTLVQAKQLEAQQKRQSVMDQYLATEELRKQQEHENKYGRSIDPNAMVAEASPIVGQTRSFGQVPTGQGRNLKEMFDQFRSGGMRPEQARPEFMAAMGQEERKGYQEQFDPLRKAQADYYTRRPSGSEPKKYHFVDSSSKQMYDENMNPIFISPEGSTPKIIGNPYAGSEFARRDALSAGAVNSVNKSKELLNDATLDELKGIRFTPGKMYSQIASPEGKELYRNLYNAIANQLYLKTGATANPSEIENNMIMYMPAANDSVLDMGSRLDMLSGEASLFTTPGKPKPQTPATGPRPVLKDAPLTSQEKARLTELREKRRASSGTF